MRSNCYFCHLKTLEKLLKKFKPGEEVAQDCIAEVHELLGNRDMTNPELVTALHRILRAHLQNEDLYHEEKEHANALLLDHQEFWRSHIQQSPSPFATAARLAVVGNIIDYGAHAVSDNLRLQIEELSKQTISIDQSDLLQEQIHRAKSVLYLGDNAGEIVFDKLFIETMHHPNLTYAVRGQAVINDVTMREAQQVGMHKLCTVIDNGYDAPSTLLSHCSDNFRTRYDAADVIISKGQGNLEGLMHAGHPHTFFLLIAKCRPVAELLGVQRGEMVITTLS